MSVEHEVFATDRILESILETVLVLVGDGDERGPWVDAVELLQKRWGKHDEVFVLPTQSGYQELAQRTQELDYLNDLGNGTHF